MRKVLDVDVAVLGAGTAGMLAFDAAVKEGARAVLIEAGQYGTTCARVGCMPSKLLIAAADRAHLQQGAVEFGLRYEGLEVDSKQVMARVRRERDRFVGFSLQEIEAIPPEQRLLGKGRFRSNTLLEVGEDCLVKFKAAVIATGSSPFIPEELQVLGDRLLTNDNLFELEELPKSVVVIGLGVIALELGQALHRLGVEVTFVGRNDKLGIFTDPELLEEALKVFAEELKILTHTRVRHVEKQDAQVTLTVDTPTGEQKLQADYVLVATGRHANLADLGLELCGVGLDSRGVPECNPHTMQCGDSNLFLAGDASGRLPLQHEAADEGRIAGRNAARYPEVREGIRRSPLSIVFSDPQMATVGQRVSCLAPGSFVSGTASFASQGRSRIMGVNKGLIKVYADCRSGQFLAAEILGPQAEHLGHLLAWAHQQGLTIQEMLNMPFYHPVIEEGIRTALGRCRRELLRVLPGGEPTLGILV